MPRTFEEVVGTLPEEDRDVVNRAVDAEREKGTKSYSEKAREVNRLLDKYKPLENSLREAGFDPEDAGFAESLKSLKSNGQQSSELEKTVRSLQKKVEEAERTASESRDRLRQRTLSEALNRTIGAQLIDGAADYVVSGLLQRGMVKMAADGETPVFVSDGIEVPFDKGVEAWKKVNATLLRNAQKPGGGSSSGKGSGTPGDQGPEMSAADWNQLPARKRALANLGGTDRSSTSATPSAVAIF